MKYFLSAFLFALLLPVLAQDTLQIMQYNLLNYGNYFNDCTTTSNNVNTKNNHLRTIISHVKPDVFTVNELSNTTSYHQMILDQVLNINGENKYRKAVSFNYADSYIVNMLYYNSEKVALYSQDVVFSAVRDIDVFTMYYKAADLAQTRDTIFFTCFVAHLKAGDSDSDATQRAGMVATAMTYIRTHNLPDNMMFMGDFNLYTNQEQAYVNLTYSYNGTRYFYDPIETEGSWNNNSTYKNVHTQSTHGNNVDCFSSGGLDDRFDFIMASGPLLEGGDKMMMLTETYRPLGNDGQHFNKSITDSPTNTSAPGQVIEALYGMSDHLPILVQLKVDANTGIAESNSPITAIRFANPSSGMLPYQVSLSGHGAMDLNVEIYDIFGRKQLSQQVRAMEGSAAGTLNLESLANGFYLFVVLDENNRSESRKFLLNKK